MALLGRRINPDFGPRSLLVTSHHFFRAVGRFALPRGPDYALCDGTARRRRGNNSRHIAQSVPSHPRAVQCSRP